MGRIFRTSHGSRNVQLPVPCLPTHKVGSGRTQPGPTRPCHGAKPRGLPSGHRGSPGSDQNVTNTPHQARCPSPGPGAARTLPAPPRPKARAGGRGEGQQLCPRPRKGLTPAHRDNPAGRLTTLCGPRGGGRGGLGPKSVTSPRCGQGPSALGRPTPRVLLTSRVMLLRGQRSQRDCRSSSQASR